MFLSMQQSVMEYYYLGVATIVQSTWWVQCTHVHEFMAMQTGKVIEILQVMGKTAVVQQCPSMSVIIYIDHQLTLSLMFASIPGMERRHSTQVVRPPIAARCNGV